MDSFEQLVSEILWIQGYWVRTSFKVELTKAEKREIGRPSNPRWELDIVAYKARENLLQVVECKSYLDSTGVSFSSFKKSSKPTKGSYKLFNEPKLQEVIFRALARQLADQGACRPGPTIKLALACGKIRNPDRENLKDYFKDNKWKLWDESWLCRHLVKMSEGSYENQVSAVVSKILLRNQLKNKG